MITTKSKKEVELMREGGRILAEVLTILEKHVEPGISAFELNELAVKLISENKARPSFLGYAPHNEKPYPAALCVSINNEVVHGLPLNEKIIRDGDLVKLDLGVEYKGLFTDAAVTIGVGNLSHVARKLLETTKNCLEQGISEIKPGVTLNNYAKAVQRHAEKKGFSIVRELVGHGVGYSVHEEPQITNYQSKLNKNVILKEGMTLALEPMINEGRWEVVLGKDGWTYETADGKLNAHFEHTVAVTERGCEIITL